MNFKIIFLIRQLLCLFNKITIPKQVYQKKRQQLIRLKRQIIQNLDKNMFKNSQNQNNSSSVKVFIRVRPLIQSQNDTDDIIQIESDDFQNKTLKIYHQQINHIQSKFDQVISQQKSQKQVFSYFQPFINKIFEGYNLTIFAYGQTGSGKTYTMFGSDWKNFIQKNIQAKKQNTYFDSLQTDQNFAGIIPRSIYHIFKNYQNNSSNFQIYCSFLQIYNQKVYDLLQDSPTPKPLAIHQSKVNGIFVQGLTQFQVKHFVDCLNLMKQGQKNRFIRQTSMNAKSSRSHTIFQILVESTTSDKKGNYVKARLNLCDLAGSQKINKSENMVSQHLLELKNINLSLTTLGKVIYALSSGKKTNVAAFRQSKLTRLLQESLTINTNTFIIGNISPSSKNIDETINTLKFAQRAGHITMKIKPIQFNENNPDSVTKLKKQIQYLKGLLNMKKKGLTEQQISNQLQKYNKNTNQKDKQGAVTQKQFQKLLHQNRRMIKQIYQLQNNVQKLKNQTSSNATQRSINSASSYNYPSESEYSLNELRKQRYQQSFILNKLNPRLKRYQNEGAKISKKQIDQNKSLLASAGKATIQYENDKIPSMDKKDLLKKFLKIQNQYKKNDSMVIQQLQSLHNNFSNKRNNLFKKEFNSVNLNQLSSQKNLPPKKYHQANVIRRGKMSLEKPLRQNEQSIHVEINSGRKKIDYSQKIKMLQNRLYRK